MEYMMYMIVMIVAVLTSVEISSLKKQVRALQVQLNARWRRRRGMRICRPGM